MSEVTAFLLWFCIIMVCDWLTKLAPLSQPMRCKTKTNCASLARVSPRLAPVKGDLDGTSFSYDCRMRFLERALLASCKNRTQLSPLNIAFTYDCRRILKHVSKSYDIFRAVCVCRKDVVG